MYELYQRYTIQMPQGVISETGVRELRSYIANTSIQADEWRALNPACERPALAALPDDWQWQWLVTGKGDYVGTFPKRVRKYYFKQFGIKCPNNFIEQLGNIARTHSEKEVSYTFEIVNRIDWHSGDYADYGSCYWGGNSGAREMLIENGGLAIRFSDEDGKGYARAWLVPVEDDLHIIFNGYGLQTINIARIFAHWQGGLDYKKIDLTNHNTDTGTLYINSGVGYIIGDTSIVESYSAYDFEWGEIDGMACDNCGETMHPDNSYIAPDDSSYCEECYYNNCFTCDDCGEPAWQDNEFYIDSQSRSVCQYCFERRYSSCYNCGEYFPVVELAVGDGDDADNWYCKNCRPAPADEPDEPGE